MAVVVVVVVVVLVVVVSSLIIGINVGDVGSLCESTTGAGRPVAIEDVGAKAECLCPLCLD